MDFTIAADAVDSGRVARSALGNQSRLAAKDAPILAHMRELSMQYPRFDYRRAILRWLAHENIETALIDPGKPWQNGTNESFNGKFRDECLSMEWFRNRVDAKIVIENWRQHYNIEVRM